jgi:hypothetical protein
VLKAAMRFTAVSPLLFLLLALACVSAEDLDEATVAVNDDGDLEFSDRHGRVVLADLMQEIKTLRSQVNVLRAAARGTYSVMTNYGLDLGSYRWEATVIASGLYLTALAAADVDGDGDNDLLLLQNTNLTWFKDDGHGSLPANSATLMTFPNVTSQSKLWTADFDNDGDSDVLLQLCYGPQSLQCKIQILVNEAGMLSGKDIFELNKTSDGLDIRSVADFNGDNLTDIVVQTERRLVLLTGKKRGLNPAESHLKSHYLSPLGSCYI